MVFILAHLSIGNCRVIGPDFQLLFSPTFLGGYGYLAGTLSYSSSSPRSGENLYPDDYSPTFERVDERNRERKRSLVHRCDRSSTDSASNEITRNRSATQRPRNRWKKTGPRGKVISDGIGTEEIATVIYKEEVTGMIVFCPGPGCLPCFPCRPSQTSRLPFSGWLSPGRSPIFTGPHTPGIYSGSFVPQEPPRHPRQQPRAAGRPFFLFFPPVNRASPSRTKVSGVN